MCSIHCAIISTIHFALYNNTVQDDELIWKSPPSRQLSREKRVEYESDVRERFYDDYIGNRTSMTIGLFHVYYS